MFGLGTLINTGAILAGGVLGLLFGKLLKERFQQAMCTACGVSVIFIGIAGAMEEMLSVESGSLVSRYGMLVTICLALGSLIGEIINLDRLFELFGEWLKRKTRSDSDNNFVSGFLNTSFTVCIGAMAIVGSIQDGIDSDWSILATKAVLDFVIVIVMTGSMGKGCIFSAIPVFIIEGGMTLLSRLIAPLLNDLSMSYLSMVGSILIFCVGLNLIRDKKIKVANMIPSLILAVAAAFLPVSF